VARKPQKGADLAPFTTMPAGETLDRTKGRRHADMTMADTIGVTPLLVWRPALRHYGSPNDAN
jgi:hypothetical protein